MAPAETFQRLAAARGVSRHGTEQLAQLPGATCIESAIGAVRQPGDFPKAQRRIGIVTFLKNKGRDPQQTQLSGLVTKRVDGLFETVNDQDQGVDPM